MRPCYIGRRMPVPARYSVVVAKDYLKFAAAHFIAYPGFREPLHGHNYQVSVRVEAELGPDGYVLDFGLVKRVAQALCEELDERVLRAGARATASPSAAEPTRSR